MKKLNPQQQHAVDSNANKILCLAGAGAGKTATMIERISRLVKEGIRPSSILVLTFTNAAGFEMKDRYKQGHPGQLIPEFRTFHSFCYSLIIKDKAVRSAIGYRDVPTIADEGAIKKLETEAKMQYKIKLSSAKLSSKPDTLSPQEKYEYELYTKAVSRLLRERNVITFDILSDKVSSLFIKNDSSILQYKDQYKYIFVDEFQDTDPKQIQFLNSFQSSNVHFYFCGDCLQNIYQFRNCSNETIKALAKDDSWEQIKLFENYRSTNQICDFANRMSTYADDEYRIEMNGQRDGEPVKVIRGAHSDWNKLIDDDHMSMLLDMVRELEGDGAILCRSNKEVQYVCDALTDAGVVYSTGKRNVDALHILRSVLDNEYMLDWLATFLTAEMYSDYIRIAAQVDNPDIYWFANHYGHLPKINERGKAIVAIRKILNSTSPNISKCADIFDVLGISDVVLEEIPESKEAIINTIRKSISEAQATELYVGTIHSSKGLEYGTVFVMGVNDKSFPLDRGEEMLNLYYVAITRAKNKLVVFRT